MYLTLDGNHGITIQQVGGRTLGKLLTPFVSVNKQYNLVPVNQW